MITSMDTALLVPRYHQRRTTRHYHLFIGCARRFLIFYCVYIVVLCTGMLCTQRPAVQLPLRSSVDDRVTATGSVHSPLQRRSIRRWWLLARRVGARASVRPRSRKKTRRVRYRTVTRAGPLTPRRAGEASRRRRVH